MRNLFTKEMQQPWSLNGGQVVSVLAQTAQTLEVSCGRIWVTISGQNEDYWLHPGEYLNVAAGSRLVLEADQGASIVHLKPQVPAVSRLVRAGPGATSVPLQQSRASVSPWGLRACT